MEQSTTTIGLIFICWSVILVDGGTASFQDIIDQYCRSSSEPIQVRTGKAGPKGPPGSRGPMGRNGDRGPRGPPGPAGMPNMTAIEDIIQEKVEKGLQRFRLTAGDSTISNLSNSVQMLRRLVLALNTEWELTDTNFLYRRFTERVRYATAESRCREYRGRLASRILRDASIVRRMIHLGYSSTSFWVGFTDRIREGTWRWADGGTTNSLTTAWRSGEPNSYRGTDEDCASVGTRVLGSHTLLMNDEPCSSTNYFVCEIEV